MKILCSKPVKPLNIRAASLGIQARAYAERGWPVLPLLPNSKVPYTHQGLLNATTDVRVVEAHWSLYPNHNIGLRTGVSFDVLDVDGEVGRASLSAKMGPAGVHAGPISRTGRGEHWLFAPSETANRANMLPKLDWRGVNGYIVAPPSIHPDGHRYEWEPDHGPDTPLPTVPGWLKTMLKTWHEPGPIIKPNEFDPNNDILAAAIEAGHVVIRNGSRYKMQCPFHTGDNDPSLVLYPNSQSGWCFGCETWVSAAMLRGTR